MAPGTSTVFQAGDLVALIGEGADVSAAERLIAGEPGARELPASAALLGQPGEAQG